jgi:ribosomal RNA-processing protein 9
VKKGSRVAGQSALLAAAISDDGRFLAVGGGDRRVHVWDVRAHEYIQVCAAHHCVNCVVSQFR